MRFRAIPIDHWCFFVIVFWWSHFLSNHAVSSMKRWVQFNSVAQSCLTVCNPMGCSMPGFPAHHQLLELAQTRTLNRWCHLTISSSVVPFSFCLQFFPASVSFPSESVLHIRWPEYWSFSFSISPPNQYSGLISFRIDWFDLLAVQGTLKSLLQYTVYEFEGDTIQSIESVVHYLYSSGMNVSPPFPIITLIIF